MSETNPKVPPTGARGTLVQFSDSAAAAKWRELLELRDDIEVLYRVLDRDETDHNLHALESVLDLLGVDWRNWEERP